MSLALFGYGYAAIVAAGGVVGYVKAGSTVSLGMGLLFGGLSAYGAYQSSVNPKNVTLLFWTSAILAGVMGYRFLGSKKFMPAGLVGGLSIGMAIATSYTMITAKSDQRS